MGDEGKWSCRGKKIQEKKEKGREKREIKMNRLGMQRIGVEMGEWCKRWMRVEERGYTVRKRKGKVKDEEEINKGGMEKEMGK